MNTPQHLKETTGRLLATGGILSRSVLNLPTQSSTKPRMTGLVQFFRVLSSCTSITMILSPSPTIYNIHKTGSAGHASILPLVSMFANCHLWMMYGYLDQNMFPIFGTFVIGDVISLCYIAVFYRSTSDRPAARKFIGAFGVALLAVTIYAVFGGLGYTNQTRSEVTSVVGYIGIGTAVMLYSSPFEKIRQVLKHRSGVFIPIHMVVAALINNSSWVVYCLLTSDWFIFGPNAFMVIMSATQVAFYMAFHPSTHPLESESDDTTTDIEMASNEATSPKVGNVLGKMATETPTYRPLQSPLAPLR